MGYIVSVCVCVYLSNGETILHNSVRLSEELYLGLLQAHQERLSFFATDDGKSLGEASRIIAINFSSPRVVGMEVRVRNKETAE